MVVVYPDSVGSPTFTMVNTDSVGSDSVMIYSVTMAVHTITAVSDSATMAVHTITVMSYSATMVVHIITVMSDSATMVVHTITVMSYSAAMVVHTITVMSDSVTMVAHTDRAVSHSVSMVTAVTISCVSTVARAVSMGTVCHWMAIVATMISVTGVLVIRHVLFLRCVIFCPS